MFYVKNMVLKFANIMNRSNNLSKFEILWLYFLGLPKTICFNFKYFPFKQAVRLPILVSHRVVLKSLKGKIILNNKQKRKFGIVKIGFGYVGIFDGSRSRSVWECNGKVIFQGYANIGHGSKICVGKNGQLEFGSGFDITAESQIVCFKHITFGNDVLISWQCLIMDTDFHKVIKNNQISNHDKEINIGNHVWIGCRCTILKGVNISDGCVIASNSNLVKSINETSSLIGGNPGKVINRDIEWRP